jgi:hypothetical protein
LISTSQLIINLIALSSRVDSPSLSAAAYRLRDLQSESRYFRALLNLHPDAPLDDQQARIASELPKALTNGH